MRKINYMLLRKTLVAKNRQIILCSVHEAIGWGVPSGNMMSQFQQIWKFYIHASYIELWRFLNYFPNPFKDT